MDKLVLPAQVAAVNRMAGLGASMRIAVGGGLSLRGEGFAAFQP